MTDTEGIEGIKEAAREAVSEGRNIADKVHDITVQALSEGKVDGERIKQILNAVLGGVRDSAKGETDEVKHIWQQTINGLDEALLKAAQASDLAVREAAGKIEDFNEHDMKRILADMETMETLLSDTLKDFAQSTQGVTEQILDDLVSHLRQSGEAVGSHFVSTLEALHRQLEQAGREGIAVSIGAVRNTSADVAQIASGVFAGIADTLRGEKKKTSSSD